jgi:hypothetical protein
MISGNHTDGISAYDAIEPLVQWQPNIRIKGLPNSTISSNHAAGAAGMYLRDGEVATSVTLHNSTVAFNTSPAGASNGIVAVSVQGTCALTLLSTLLAGNSGAADADFSPGGCAVSPSGGFNLTQKTTFSAPTWIGGDPMLGPLADNGGPTLTHALAPGSPAIDHGANPDNRATDQRGGGISPATSASRQTSARTNSRTISFTTISSRFGRVIVSATHRECRT